MTNHASAELRFQTVLFVILPSVPFLRIAKFSSADSFGRRYLGVAMAGRDDEVSVVWCGWCGVVVKWLVRTSRGAGGREAAEAEGTPTSWSGPARPPEPGSRL